MRKLITLLLLSVSLSAFSQIQIKTNPARSLGNPMLKDSALFVGKLAIPHFSGTNSLGGYVDRWGQSFALNRADTTLSVRLGTTYGAFPNKAWVTAGLATKINSSYPYSKAEADAKYVSLTVNNNMSATITSTASISPRISSATEGATVAWSLATNGFTRFLFSKEGGGGDFFIKAYDNSNTLTSIPLAIVRATGEVQIPTLKTTGKINFNGGTGTALQLMRVNSGNTANEYVTPLIDIFTANSMEIVNSTTSALSVETLNSTYPNVRVGYRVICHLITGAPAIYTKATEAGGSDVWLTTTATVTP